ncbi:MAG: sulfatase [Armatimonadetes bacterium]|nr:sulfatase [Armatimonadota bacterium]
MMPNTRPNLLFVFADQLRAREIDDPLSPLITPAYQRLCAEGQRFGNMVANCPVCTPSRAMLLTGQYPLANRVVANDLPLPEDSVTIGRLLADAGYRTGYVGKWHLDGSPRDGFTPPGPRRHGFDTWAVHNCIHNYLHSAYYGDTPDLQPIPGYEPAYQTDIAEEFIEADGDQPWSLFVSWGPPHDPYPQVPSHYQRMYDAPDLPYPATWLCDDPSLHPPGGRLRSMNLPWDPESSYRQYLAAITALDDQLSRLLLALDRTGQASRTIVVYTSDHGDMLWNHGRMFKQQPWDEAVRIPFVIRWPGQVPAGAEHDGCLSIADLTPSLLPLLGIDVPAGMEGTNCSAALCGHDRVGPESAFLLEPVSCDQSYDMAIPEWRGVRTKRHTYIRTRTAPWLLYDNLADPDQCHNLVGQPGTELLQAALESELAGFMGHTGDMFEPGERIVRRLGLCELWNKREQELHPRAPRLLE